MRNIEASLQQDEGPLDAAQSYASKPRFTIIVDARRSTLDALIRSIRSIEQQVYGNWIILVVGNEGSLTASAISGLTNVPSLARALDHCEGDFIVPLMGGDQLSKWSLFYFAQALQSQPAATILYGDEDEVDERGARRRPWFKPRWNKELFLARDYLSRACAINAASVRAVAAAVGESIGDSWVFDLLLHVIAATESLVVHVPRIVAHVQNVDAQADQRARIQAVARHVGALGASASAGPFESVKVSWPLPTPPPLVSVIVPTKDKLELLRPCVESVLKRTRYQAFELIVVDNDSVEPRTRRYLDDLAGSGQVRVLSYPRPYNYSAINNHAVRNATGSFVCLLNNDTEVIEPDWLCEMMRYAVRTEIGAVGAKLLYGDGTIQHAGVIVGIGGAAGHAHRNLSAADVGYFGHAHLPQFVSAVTGACLLVDKRKFLAVGGLDEEFLPIAYNDVDLCLKLELAGLRNVYVPHAVLVHHESKSRPNDHAPSRIESYRRELEAFQDRWGAKNYMDPLFNPNLDRSSETFLIQL